jgi:hypothetical protein
VVLRHGELFGEARLRVCSRVASQGKWLFWPLWQAWSTWKQLLGTGHGWSMAGLEWEHQSDAQKHAVTPHCPQSLFNQLLSQLLALGLSLLLSLHSLMLSVSTHGPAHSLDLGEGVLLNLPAIFPSGGNQHHAKKP